MAKNKKIEALPYSELYLLYYLIKGKRKKYYSFNTENSEFNYNFFWALYRTHKGQAINFNKVKLRLDGYYEDSAVKNIADFLEEDLKGRAKKILCDSEQRAFFKLLDEGYEVEEFLDLMENNNKFAVIGDHITYDVWENIVFKFKINKKQWETLDAYYTFYLDKFTKDEIAYKKQPKENPHIRYIKQREILLNIIKILLDEFPPKNLNILGLYKKFSYKSVNIYKEIDILEHLLILERDKIIKINKISFNSRSLLDNVNIDIDEKKFNIFTKDLKLTTGLNWVEKVERDIFFDKKILKKIDCKIKFDSNSGILFFKNKKINFINKPNQKDLLTTIFKDQKKKWYYDEIQEDWDPKADLLGVYRDNFWKKFYNAGYDINNAVAIETQIKDFLVKNTKHIQINPKYLQ